MKVSIGRIVIVRGITSNGSDEHPAIVNRAWADHDTKDAPVLANLTVFPDVGVPTTLGSVKVYETKAEAQAAQGDDPASLVAHWPERV